MTFRGSVVPDVAGDEELSHTSERVPIAAIDLSTTAARKSCAAAIVRSAAERRTTRVPRKEGNMVKGFNRERPACQHCGDPLPIKDGVLTAWRSTSGAFFCNEWCAEDAEEANWRNRRRG
jgi:hypothetical protein